MSSTLDYKKRLKEYRKSIRATNLKTVTFKEANFLVDEDIEYNTSSHLPPHETHYQHHQMWWENKEPIAEYIGPRSISRTPSPQLQAQVVGNTGFVNESNLLSEPIGRYINWNSSHSLLASQPWSCIGDLMHFCDKYEFKAISVSDIQTHANIVSEVKALLSGKAPFDKRRRFPGTIRNEGHLLVCIGRCPSIEYHLQRILTIFRRPLNKLPTDKQNISKQNFHLAMRELRLDVSARITEVKLYDRSIFEKQFHLRWQDTSE